MGRRKILFVSESVTLAQVTRLLTLARSLDVKTHEVHFAASEFPPFLFDGTSFVRHSIRSITSQAALRGALRGKRMYDHKTLEGYLEEELELFSRIKPDLVVGDFRWSLAVSAPLSKVPYAGLANAYWHCQRAGRAFPLPDHPTVSLFGESVASWFFPLVRPFVFRHHAAPLNALRKRFGFPTLGSLEDVLTHSDFTLYADVPALTGIKALSSTERYLGPVLWSPSGDLPAWWNEVTDERPLVYFTMGSSGRLDEIRRVVEAVRDAGAYVMVSTAGRTSLDRVEGAWAHDFLPGDLAAKRASLVVCNGGSTTAYQALAEGVPVLGIPSNLDQYLSMQGIVAAGAGESVRHGTSAKAITQACRRLLSSVDAKTSAKKIADEFRLYPASDNFWELLREVGCAP